MNSIQENIIKNDFDEVMNTLKSVLNIKTNVEMAEKLGIGISAYGERARRQSIPYEKIFEFCLSHGININYIFTTTDEFKNSKTNIYAPIKIQKYKNYKLFGDDANAEPFNFTNEFCDDFSAKFSAVVADNIHMFPVIDVGDIVIVNENDKVLIENGKLFLVKYKGNVLVTRLFIAIDPNEYIMKFESPLLDDVKTELKNFTILGKVVSVHTSMA